jgi:hypothetical protein
MVVQEIGDGIRDISVFILSEDRTMAANIRECSLVPVIPSVDRKLITVRVKVTVLVE